MIPEARLRALLREFQGKHILVVGDLMLDEFIWGKVSRISPEAPVPVVEVQRESQYPGGAANVARNLRRFTSRVSMMGLVGSDIHGRQLTGLLSADGISVDGVAAQEDFPTIVKTRVIARQQQLVRVDRERRVVLPEKVYAALLASYARLLPSIDALLIEDYGKGLLTQDFIDALISQANQAGKIVTVDPNPYNPLQWKNVHCVKPNRAEAFASAGALPSDAVEPVESDRALLQVAEKLLGTWETQLLLITLGEQGMLLLGKEIETYHTPTRARKVFDISGAGDTAIALFTLALTAGAQPWEAAEIANHASGVVVGKLGTETVSPEELSESFGTTGKSF